MKPGKRGKIGYWKQPTPGSPVDRANGAEVDWAAALPVFEAARQVTRPTFVYCIGEEHGGAVKIGVSRDPVKRLRGMQTGNPRRLCVERVLMGDRYLEQLLHEMWEPLAIPSAISRGRLDAAPLTEWFAPEIRRTLYPIIDSAAELQIAYVGGLADHEPVDVEALENALRLAVQGHSFTPHRRRDPRLVSRTGHRFGRPSRV